MTDIPMFPIHLPRGADDWTREAGITAAQITCYGAECDGDSFEIIAVANDRHYRIVCGTCGVVQPEFIGLHLGQIDGAA